MNTNKPLILFTILFLLFSSVFTLADNVKIKSLDVKKNLIKLKDVLIKKYLVKKRIFILPVVHDKNKADFIKFASLLQDDIKNVFIKKIGYEVKNINPKLSQKILNGFFNKKGIDAFIKKNKLDYAIVSKCYAFGDSVKMMSRIYSADMGNFITAVSSDANLKNNPAASVNMFSRDLIIEFDKIFKRKTKILEYEPYSFGLNITGYLYGTFSGFQGIEGGTTISSDILGTKLSLAFLAGFDFFLFPNINFKFSIGTSGFEFKNFSYVMEIRYFLSEFSHGALPYFGIGFSSLSFSLKDDAGSTIVNAINNQNSISFQVGFDWFTLFPSIKKKGFYLETELAVFFGVNKGGTVQTDTESTSINFDSPEGYQIRTSIGWRFW